MNLPRAFGWSGGGFLGHAWSLAVEEQFYLVWPPVVIVLLRRAQDVRRVGAVAAAAAVLSLAGRVGLDLAGVRGEALYNFTLTHVDGIFAGCALAVFWRLRHPLVDRLARPGTEYVALAAIVAVVATGWQTNLVGLAVAAAATASLIAGVLARPHDPVGRMFGSRPLVEIGKRSYGLYLYHWPIFLFLGIDRRPAVLAAGLGATVVATWFSYRFIEQPFLRLKDRWQPGR
jgi:peptidoglycan/LPS O-acetylase OafA/YrhL